MHIFCSTCQAIGISIAVSVVEVVINETLDWNSSKSPILPSRSLFRLINIYRVQMTKRTELIVSYSGARTKRELLKPKRTNRRKSQT